MWVLAHGFSFPFPPGEKRIKIIIVVTPVRAVDIFTFSPLNVN